MSKHEAATLIKSVWQPFFTPSPKGPKFAVKICKKFYKLFFTIGIHYDKIIFVGAKEPRRYIGESYNG